MSPPAFKSYGSGVTLMATAPRVLGPVLAALLGTACAGTTPATSDDRSGAGGRGDVSGTSTAAAGDQRGAGACVPGSGTDHPVGPGQKHAKLADVPWARLGPGDTVRVHHRAEPYHEKIMVSGRGRADAPIKVCGVRGPKGELPIIDGANAVTPPGLEFPYDGHQVRGLVIIGKRHSAPYREQPEHIVIDGLEIRNAAAPHRFIDRAGKDTPFSNNAAGIFLQRGDHITIRNCAVHDNGNGLFLGTSGSEELSHDVLIEGNHIYSNASPTEWYEHNVYNEVSGVVFQFNRFGPPKSGDRGTLGANIKERSAGVVIRYNWIEDGAHLIDLVDSQEAREPNVKDPAFHESWVYGNVLIRGREPNGSMVHYGGDSGIFETYRKGTLHFFNNTVVVKNARYPEWQSTQVFEISTNDEKLDMRNNAVVTEVRPTDTKPVVLLGARDGVIAGDATLANNWLSEGVAALDGFPGKPYDRKAKVTGFEASLRGADAGFQVGDTIEPWPKATSALAGKGAAIAGRHPLAMQYLLHGKGEPRPAEAALTIGAFAARP